MIRRRVGDEFFLITQHDHALLSGEFARHFGNSNFVRPDPFDAMIQGVSLHDCGWPLHDDCPTLNSLGEPIDVFESTRPLAFKVWTASAERAAAVDPYVGLLVSLHVLSLSTFAASPPPGMKHEQFDVSSMTERFEINKFQHREIERQERLRKQLGLRTDQPLHLGLAPKSNDPDEEKLLFNFRLLQAMDLTSLAICCTQPPTGRTQDLLYKPGGQIVYFTFDRVGPQTLAIDPWPFDRAQMTFDVPFRRVPARSYASDAEFQQIYASVATEQMTVTLIEPSKE